MHISRFEACYNIVATMQFYIQFLHLSVKILFFIIYLQQYTIPSDVDRNIHGNRRDDKFKFSNKNKISIKNEKNILFFLQTQSKRNDIETQKEQEIKYFHFSLWCHELYSLKIFQRSVQKKVF